MTDIGVGSWPARRARIDPRGVALRQDGRAVSYLELARRVDTLAASLARLGTGRGDKIAYLGPNDIATFETMFAAGRLGAVFVPLNIRLSAPEIASLLTDCGARVLVYGPESAALAGAAVGRAAVGQLIALRPAGDPGGLDYQQLAMPPGPAGPGGIPAGPDGMPPGDGHADVSLDDDALLLYTSGTTGQPKGAVLTHGNITFNTVNQLAGTDVLSTDVVLCCAPLFHVAGLGQVTLPTFFKGGTIVVVPRFDAGPVLGMISELGVTAFPAVPTMLQMMCDHPGFAAADLSSLRYIVYGGSPVLARVARAWAGRGVLLLQGYGMTEAAPGVLLSAPAGALDRVLSAGVPQFYLDLALLAPDGTVTRPPGTGELLARGPNVFRGYLNRAAESARALDGGWLHTGDIVRMDPDGWGYVIGRAKDMIISGGENIYPAEVERAIAEIPGVADVAVVGVPDERWGEVGFAAVVPHDGAVIDPGAIRAQLDQRLARYKIPQYIRIAGRLPRTSTGKVIRAALREMAAGEMSTGEMAPVEQGAREPGRAGKGDGAYMIVDTLEDLRPLVGQHLGTSGWVEVGQPRIDAFGDATDDHQWIHVDPDRARHGPFGTTVAHGYLTLALLIPMWNQILDVRDVRTKVNYGLGKVRFPAPVPAGAKIRAAATLAQLDDIDGGMQLTIGAVVHREGSDKPVCVAEPIFRFYR